MAKLRDVRGGVQSEQSEQCKARRRRRRRAGPHPAARPYLSATTP